MTARRKAVTPKIDAAALDYISNLFGKPHTAANYILTAFPVLYRRTLIELKGKLDIDELRFLIGIMNGTVPIPEMAGQMLIPKVEDAILLDALPSGFGINPTVFRSKLNHMEIFQLHCLEIWAMGFWNSTDTSDASIENYLKSLADKY